MPMKILLLIDNLGSGGAQNQFSMLARELDSKGCEIVLVTYYPQSFFLPRLSGTNIKHIQLRKTSRLGLNIIWQLRRILRDNKFDLIMSFLDTPNFYLSVARRMLARKPPIVISYRSQTMFAKVSRVELEVKKWMNNSANAIVTNSHHERSAWLHRHPELEGKIYTIYNSVDFTRFTARKNSKRGETLRLLCVGNVSQDKNALTVVMAMDKLTNQLKANVSLTWVGSRQANIIGQKKYIEVLDREIRNRNLTEKWNWKNPIESIETIYHEYDVLIHAAIREGVPNVVCEALSCGMPVILSDILDHPNLSNSSKNGIMFDPNISEELVSSVLRMIACSDDEFLGYQQNAALFAQNNFDMDTHVSSYLKLFGLIVK